MGVDYFGKYFTEDGFDFHSLINDDFVQPVRLLFQQMHYVSAAKLLMVAIDSIGYIEYGDGELNPFRRWLDTYARLTPLKVTSEELWEHRNSLLHMSNLRSRRVAAGKVRMLVAYIGDIPAGVDLKKLKHGCYDLRALILEVGQAMNRWLETYDRDRSKIDDFVARYDLIASDARMLHFAIPHRPA